MKVFGHPIHPLIIHFPTALLPMDLLLSSMNYIEGDAVYGLAGFYCLSAGSAAGIIAMVTGVIDFLSIGKEKKKAIAAAIYHGFINGTIILVFTLITYLEWIKYPNIDISLSLLLIKATLVLALFLGNYLGGRLIYKYFIGINFKTKQDEQFI